MSTLEFPSRFKLNKKRRCIKFSFLFILSSFISKTFGDILEGKLVNKNVPKCWPEVLSGDFYWPGASSSLLALSPVMNLLENIPSLYHHYILQK